MSRQAKGLTLVSGVAGSGKTSVALGRTKFLCSRTEGEDADPDFFRSETAVGFVLNSQLATYLRKAVNDLLLFDMATKEYRELRIETFRHRQIDQDGTYSHDLSAGADQTAAPEGRMTWLRAADLAVAAIFAARLRIVVASLPGEREGGGLRRRGQRERTAEQRDSLQHAWAQFGQDIETIAASLERRPGAHRWLLDRLASRVDEARTRFADRLDAALGWTGAEAGELRQAARASVRDRIVRALRLTDAYATAICSGDFEEHLRWVNSPRDEAALVAARRRLTEKKLSDSDVDVLISLAHIMSLGYRGRHGAFDAVSHWVEPTWASQVFIDEFQDFSEVQLFFMGEQADPAKRAVTVVGDFAQQLTTGVPVRLDECFPWASDAERTMVRLLENKRQAGPLARFSQRYREVVLGDAAVEDDIDISDPGSIPRLVFAYDLAQSVVDEVLLLPPESSVAVICPSRDVAIGLEKAVRSQLGASFRETRFSSHGELTRRHFVHFTVAFETKGLEFDAVLVAGVEHFELADSAAANACYVAITRPREHLSLLVNGPIDARIKDLLAQHLMVPVLDERQRLEERYSALVSIKYSTGLALEESQEMASLASRLDDFDGEFYDSIIESLERGRVSGGKGRP